MSGFLKSFDRLIPQQIISSNTHKLRLSYCLARQSAAAYYFNPLIRLHGLPQSHDLDLNQLATCAYNLLRQTNNYNQLLPQSKQYADLQQELSENIVKNQFALEQLSHSLKVQLQIGKSNITIDSAASIVYTLAHQGNTQELTNYLNSSLNDVILSKIQYASDQNIIDLIDGLATAQLFDNKALWDSLLKTASKRQWNFELQPVSAHGWETALYEQTKCQKSQQFYKNIYQYYLVQSQKGNSTIAGIKKNLFQLFDQFLFRVAYPVFHREHRIQYRFDCVNPTEEKENLFNTLESVQQKVPGASNLLQDLKSRQQTY